MRNIQKDKILILDFGSQYSQLIARRIREIGVYCELLPFDVNPKSIQELNPKGVILSGGPESVYANAEFKIPEPIFKLGCPILGICYGMQAMTHQLAGEVSSSNKKEFGYTKVKILQMDSQLFTAIDNQDITVWMSHGDKVTKLPAGFVTIANSADTEVTAMADYVKNYYGVQFHPEVTHTEFGMQILSNFVLGICQCKALWSTCNIVEQLIDKIQALVGKDTVILGLSGGVDSSVVAALLHKAIGKQLNCVFVDTGLLRLHEGDMVMETFAKHMGINVTRVNAKQRYMQALANISDPERKRKVIGNLFVDIFEEQAAKLPQAKWLAQGTIYPDVIESADNAASKAHVIKSHHNVGGLPDYMKLKLLEPIRDLFKDEVRKLGVELGIEKSMIQRHPFPGPGLGVRVLGEVKAEYVEILRAADDVFISTLRKHNYYYKVSQAFAVFMPIKSVGVVGDQRQYEYVIALRAVETVDFMTANWARLPYELLDEVAHAIVNSVPNVSRVVYDISGKPPSTIEWE